MNKKQYLVIGIAVLVFLGLYFGFSTIPPEQRSLEKLRDANLESTGVENLIRDAIPTLHKSEKSLIDAYNFELEKSGEDTLQRIDILKNISKTWYESGHPAISGSYAEKIAELSGTDDTWSIAGTTYLICFKNTEDAKTKDFCIKRAVRAFEKAISLNPDKIEPRINLALCYVENPSKENPMQGILMLRDLNEKHPENVSVLNQLGLLSLETNQPEKALERLEAAISLDPDNKRTVCLLAEAYQIIGDVSKAEEYKQRCVN